MSPAPSVNRINLVKLLIKNLLTHEIRVTWHPKDQQDLSGMLPSSHHEREPIHEPQRLGPRGSVVLSTRDVGACFSISRAPAIFSVKR